MNTRIIKIRKYYHLTQEKFALRMGISKNYVNLIENGKKQPSDRLLICICKEFSINEEWLLTGNGEMFEKSLAHNENDEISEYVLKLLEYNGEGNPLYDIIIDMMKAYSELDNLSQIVVKEWLEKIKQYNKKPVVTIPKEISISQNKETDIEERMKVYREYLEEKEKVTEKLSS